MTMLVIKGVLSLLALVIGSTPWLVDYNQSHVLNEAWPPHARFHNAQTMVFASLCSAAALWLLWRPVKQVETRKLQFAVACFFTAIYTLSAIPSVFFPGAAFEDAEHAGHLPTLFGTEINQLRAGVVWCGVVALLWWFGQRSMPQQEKAL